ncbi:MULTISPECIES: hypothetical protein [unclassified Thermosynechococcus]|uniref:hypothetical protein n=1 Tax=unclassified Thermosynechococcus TaxID=2622553 RepID=UPI0025CB861D|nr:MULTISPECIES: hypothetical protein [unclassified Thermosynechococcus]
MAWLIYDLGLRKAEGTDSERYYLTKVDEVLTEFQPALLAITTPSPGTIDHFIKILQEKLDDQLEAPPVRDWLALVSKNTCPETDEPQSYC